MLSFFFTSKRRIAYFILQCFLYLCIHLTHFTRYLTRETEFSSISAVFHDKCPCQSKWYNRNQLLLESPVTFKPTENAITEHYKVINFPSMKSNFSILSVDSFSTLRINFPSNDLKQEFSTACTMYIHDWHHGRTFDVSMITPTMVETYSPNCSRLKSFWSFPKNIRSFRIHLLRITYGIFRQPLQLVVVLVLLRPVLWKHALQQLIN